MSPIILQRENEANLASYLAIGSKACKPPTLALKDFLFINKNQ